ncbi:protein IQ-DOMAIN 14 [Triticum aestivum]|uniref:protein IQ-DOMAIN 14 n=1 Tax=Triticum aestivum TaxID=4565 RepID=UPI001D00277D|nr:protein IQ-DOMAIN 14-like [Triticum aestivum]
MPQPPSPRAHIPPSSYAHAPTPELFASRQAIHRHRRHRRPEASSSPLERECNSSAHGLCRAGALLPQATATTTLVRVSTEPRRPPSTSPATTCRSPEEFCAGHPRPPRLHQLQDRIPSIPCSSLTAAPDQIDLTFPVPPPPGFAPIRASLRPLHCLVAGVEAPFAKRRAPASSRCDRSSKSAPSRPKARTATSPPSPVDRCTRPSCPASSCSWA